MLRAVRRVCVLSYMVSIAGSCFAQSIVSIGVAAGDSGSRVDGVSADGTMFAATSSTSGSNWGSRSHRWSAGGGFGQALSSWPRSYTRAISGDGSTLVGYNSDFPRRAFRWTQAGGVHELTSPESPFSNIEPMAINHDGAVVVGQFSPFSAERAFRWTESGGMEDLGALPGATQARADGVSGDGSVIVGSSGTSLYNQYVRGFRWTQAEGMQDIGVLPGTLGTRTRAISADGLTIVGSSITNWEQPFRWRNGVMQGLGLPWGHVTGVSVGVNADGSVIVGAAGQWLDPMLSPELHATIWTETLGNRLISEYLTILGVDMSGWYLEYATGVSGDGNVIAGFGTYNGEERGWIVTIPSPSTGAWLLMLGVMAGSRRRRSTVVGGMSL